MEEIRGHLYLVPTPIGNLEDMTYRGVRILSEADYVAAEDTRHTRQLLNHYQIEKPLISYHEHNKEEKGDYLLSLLAKGKQIALVSDAGMPAISDPGADIANKAVKAGYEVTPLPGANAALTALIASGLDTREFTFIGFLPKRSVHARERLHEVAKYRGTLIFYEAPHRLKETLRILYEVLGDRQLTIARELTKRFESFWRGSLMALIEQPEQIVYKGEFVLLLSSCQEDELTSEKGQNQLLEERAVTPIESVLQLINTGMAKKEAIRQIAREQGLGRRDLYNAVEKALTEEEQA